MVTIIGSGEMAQALIAGLTQEGMEVEVVARDMEQLLRLEALYPIKKSPLQDFDIEGKVVILAVKPQALEDVARQVRGKAAIVLSVLAGTPIEKLHLIPSDAYVRAMPNIAAGKKASMTALSGDEGAKEIALNIFSKIGRTLWLQSEKELDIATAIAGSGPAFLALVAEALMDGGVAAGLKRSDAIELTRGLFYSFSSLDDEHPALIKDRVMSPAGTTAAGYSALERGAVRSSFMEAVLQAYKRTLKAN